MGFLPYFRKLNTQKNILKHTITRYFLKLNANFYQFSPDVTFGIADKAELRVKNGGDVIG